MEPSGKRIKRTGLVRTDRFVVAVEVDAMILDCDPDEISFLPEAVELLREVEARAKRGDVEWLKRHGKVYAAVEAA